MKRIVCIVLFLMFMAPIPAKALEAPLPPDSAQELMPAEQENFGQALWNVLSDALSAVWPDIAASAGICASVLAVCILSGIVRAIYPSNQTAVQLCTAVILTTILLLHTNTMIRTGTDTVTQLAEYAKALFPVLSAAMAAQGGVNGATTLYAGTIMFNALLSDIVSSLLVPMIYVILVLSVAASALGEESVHKLRDLVKGMCSWILKTALYVFTGYITVTGVISGAADQSALKATKLTISSMVPVVGGILSDASEAVLIGADLVKNSLGIYGMLAMVCVVIGPFLQIGVHYLLLKLTASVSAVFADKQTTDLIADFSGAMGLVLAMTGSLCLMLCISAVCFMKGVT